jgi:hypothetical protein
MLIQSLFGKTIDQLTERDLISFFEVPRYENDKLEFKSYRIFSKNQEKGSKTSKNNEAFRAVVQTICAFLNTDGGILIWGAPEGKISDGSEKAFYGNLTPLELNLEKDQTINKIVGHINPTPNRIRFQAIQLKSQQFVYVFEVSPSDFAPHQVYGTYFMRLDGQSGYAPHQYVDALIKKIKVPRLEMRFHFGEIHRVKDLAFICFSIWIYNSSQLINEKCVHLDLSTYGQVLQENEEFTGFKGDSKLVTEIANVLHYGAPIRKYFTLLTPYTSTHTIRRVPIIAKIYGESSPMIISSYTLEVRFNKSQLSYAIYQMTENEYASDVPSHETERILDIVVFDFEHRFRGSDAYRQMEKWKDT